MVSDNVPIIFNATTQVASKAVDSGGRILKAGTKSLRISVGSISQGFQGVYEVRFMTSNLLENWAAKLIQHAVTNRAAGKTLINLTRE